MARTLKSDRWLFLLTLLLVGTGVLMVYSASAIQANDKFGTPYYFLYRQLTWAVLGFLAMGVVMRIDYREYRRPAVIWSLFGVTIAMLIAVFFAPKINGTHRWLSLGGASFQPSEIGKLVAVLFTAAVLERRMHRLTEVTYALAPIGLVTITMVALILAQPDYGTSAVIVMVVMAMVFAAGLQYRYLLAAALLIMPAAIALIFTAEYRLRRMVSFLDPWADARGDGYQVIQSMLAIASGGVFGLGLMGGVQKQYYLPEAHTDFIYAVIGEEFGLIGTIATLTCFILIAWRGLRVSLLASDRFGSLLALGITMTVTLQALVNISVVMSLLPTKGIPLPFVSNGGSSLLISMIGMGVLLNISQHASAVAGARSSARTAWALERQEA